MKRLRIEIQRCPAELRKGLEQVIRRRAEMFASPRSALDVGFVKRANETTPRIDFRFDQSGVTIGYTRTIDAFRGLGRVMGLSFQPESRTFSPRRHGGTKRRAASEDLFVPSCFRGNKCFSDFSETCHFDLLGVLVDFSRNGVLRPETAEDLMVSLALMGFNALVPYMEDTFEVPGEPFFGYLRGRYTQADLKRIDRFAQSLGMEVMAGVQTLGHLEQVLQWPAYAHLRDVPGVLLADYPPTYAFLEKIIRAATAPLRSKRIYACMDEAHGLGTGRYRAMFGQKNPFDILNGHMRRVVEICNKLGLRPMTSGDMYFRVGSKDNWYYDEKSVIPESVAKAIPREMQLVYWDYYHTDRAFYDEWIDRHRALGTEPIISGGVWTWSHFWAHLPFSIATTDALMTSAKAKGVRENVACLWGDDGMECDLFSALPGMQYYADHAYSDGSPDRATTAANLRGTCGINFDAWMTASEIDQLPTLADPKTMPQNCSKWLLWEDPMLGLLEPELGRHSAQKHYANLATRLSKLSRGSGMQKRLRFPEQIARVLSLKVGLRPRLSKALRQRDRKTLALILRNELPTLRREVDKLWKLHRALWLDQYKPFGLEVLDARYGRLRTRLQTLADRLGDYLSGKIDSIPELEAPLRRIFKGEDVYSLIDHGRAATASMIK